MTKLEFESEYINHFLTDKNHEADFENEEDCQLCMDKITGQRVVMYSRGGTPFLFMNDQKSGIVQPSMYMLFQACPTYPPKQLLPLKIFLKATVEHFIFNGADLMWPGIKKIDLTVAPEITNLIFQQNQLAVVYAYNGMIETTVDGETVKTPQYCPIATGRMINKGEILNGEPGQGLPKKGKAVFIDHYLYDELWNMGSRKIPQEFTIKAEIKETTEDMEKQQEAPEEEEEKVELSVEEWDERIKEAFIRSIHEAVENADLPLEPSDF